MCPWGDSVLYFYFIISDLEVREGGENFSAGQLQLINMARAALRKSSLIIFDEATSALDASTEKSLLQTAAVVFKKNTVITIAVSLFNLTEFLL